MEIRSGIHGSQRPAWGAQQRQTKLARSKQCEVRELGRRRGVSVSSDTFLIDGIVKLPRAELVVGASGCLPDVERILSRHFRQRTLAAAARHNRQIRSYRYSKGSIATPEASQTGTGQHSPNGAWQPTIIERFPRWNKLWLRVRVGSSEHESAT